MNNLFFNEVAAAVLASALGVICINKFAGAMLSVDNPDESEFAYSVAADAAGPVEKIIIPFPSAAWIGARDADKGAKVFKKCQSCHNAEDGGANSTGPNLWGVVGAKRAMHPAFKYSAAMTNKGGTWTYEDLDTFLTKPSAFVPKTAMGFVGLKKETDRSAVIEYLRQHSSSPMAPLTEAAPIPTADGDDTHGVDVQGAGTQGHGDASTIPTLSGGDTGSAAEIIKGAKTEISRTNDTEGEMVSDVLQGSKDKATDVFDDAKDKVEELKDGGH